VAGLRRFLAKIFAKLRFRRRREKYVRGRSDSIYPLY